MLTSAQRMILPNCHTLSYNYPLVFSDSLPDSPPTTLMGLRATSYQVADASLSLLNCSEEREFCDIYEAQFTMKV